MSAWQVIGAGMTQGPHDTKPDRLIFSSSGILVWCWPYQFRGALRCHLEPTGPVEMKLQYCGTCRKDGCSAQRAALGAAGVPVACDVLAKSEAFVLAHAAGKQTENSALHDGISLGRGKSALHAFFIFAHATACLIIHL